MFVQTQYPCAHNIISETLVFYNKEIEHPNLRNPLLIFQNVRNGQTSLLIADVFYKLSLKLNSDLLGSWMWWSYRKKLITFSFWFKSASNYFNDVFFNWPVVALMSQLYIVTLLLYRTCWTTRWMTSNISFLCFKNQPLPVRSSLYDRIKRNHPVNINQEHLELGLRKSVLDSHPRSSLSMSFKNLNFVLIYW